MSREFRRAVVDTILPGVSGLPSGSAAGVLITDGDAPLLAAIAAAAGGEAAFAAGAEALRTEALRRVEREMPEAFRALVASLLADYYESATALAALGWRSAPPQPSGHAMPPDDETLPPLLERVRRRGEVWRR
jgi:hypothetical protein